MSSKNKGNNKPKVITPTKSEINEHSNKPVEKLPSELDIVNAEYSDLCTKYGDAIVKVKGWNNEIASLEKAIQGVQRRIALIQPGS